MSTVSMLLLATLLGCNAGGSTAPQQRVCESLAIAAAFHDAFVEKANLAYEATEREMHTWEEWKAGTITTERDGTGEFSGALRAAELVRKSGDAYCEAAELHRLEFEELARRLDSADWRSISPFARIGRLCRPSRPLIDQVHPEGRKVFQDDRKQRTSQEHDAVHRVVDACFTEFGGAPPVVHVP